jgi:hypothetical protein
MVSDLQPYVLTSSPARRQLLRLTVQPQQQPGTIHGGWWPRSLDPLAEFPALIAGIAMRLGPVTRLTYNLDTWGGAPWCMVVDGETVRLEGFHSIDPRTVKVSGQEWGRRVLLIVPPDTAPNAAEFERASAASPVSLDGVEQVLQAAELDH